MFWLPGRRSRAVAAVADDDAAQQDAARSPAAVSAQRHRKANACNPTMHHPTQGASLELTSRTYRPGTDARTMLQA